MQPIGKLPPQDWMTFTETVKVMEAIMAEGNVARFVGGCVRDAILNRPITDVDIATNEPPTQVVRLLETAGIQVVPFGLDHGSVLAVQPNMTFHITTLRADLETYGRHALVNYIDDWQQDAIRRDFTMNALYADLDGKLYDPVDGLKDIKAGVVKFIGDPLERIHEDYLRILRYFRFQAYYAQEPPAKEYLEACRLTAQHLRKLSGERVWYELKRILQADKPYSAIKNMDEYGILSEIFSSPTQIKHLPNLIKLELKIGAPRCAVRRLASFFDGNVTAVQQIRQDLPVSTNELSHLIKLTKLLHDEPDLSSPYQNYKILYEHGTGIYQDFILLNAAYDEQNNLEQGLKYLQEWTSPTLPIRGQDLLDHGISSGPKMGRTIQEVTDWWLDHACKPNREQCLQWLRNRNLVGFN